MQFFGNFYLFLAWMLALVALAGNLVVTSYNVNSLIANDIKVQHTYQVKLDLAEIEHTVVSAQTSVRGFLILGNTEFLAPYQLSVNRAERQIESLRQKTVDNPQQQEHVAQLSKLTAAKFRFLSNSILLSKEKGVAEAKALMETGEGKMLMDRVSEVLDQMNLLEDDLLARRADVARRGYRTTIVAGLLGGGIAIGMTLTAFVLVRREFLRRQAIELKLYNKTREEVAYRLEQADLLEKKVAERTSQLNEAIAALVVEVDDRTKAEEREQPVAVELRRSNEELEKFAYVASHDLQEPLRKIQAFGDRLAKKYRDELGETGRDYLDRMLSSAGRMRTLIEDLLTFSRVTTKGQPFALVDLNAVAAEVYDVLEVRLGQSQGTIEFGSLPSILADGLQMKQLFQNLISNALKFHQPGVPPAVRVWAENLAEIPADRDPPPLASVGWRLSFADNGIGFEQTYVSRIFEVFQRLHGRGEYEGTGIGLAICRKIVERHGGAIEARSQPGAGAIFYVDLPTLAEKRA